VRIVQEVAHCQPRYLRAIHDHLIPLCEVCSPSLVMSDSAQKKQRTIDLERCQSAMEASPFRYPFFRKVGFMEIAFPDIRRVTVDYVPTKAFM
jgi:hypothetical protein